MAWRHGFGVVRRAAEGAGKPRRAMVWRHGFGLVSRAAEGVLGETGLRGDWDRQLLPAGEEFAASLQPCPDASTNDKRVNWCRVHRVSLRLSAEGHPGRMR